MIELYQAEWCPHSHRVRQRLTELGLDVIMRQVAADPAHRAELARVSAQRSIPAIVFDDGTVVCGEDSIITALDQRFPERSAAQEHREKALEEWPEWLRLAASS
jgi:glutathione S-transferase